VSAVDDAKCFMSVVSIRSLPESELADELLPAPHIILLTEVVLFDSDPLPNFASCVLPMSLLLAFKWVPFCLALSVTYM